MSGGFFVFVKSFRVLRFYDGRGRCLTQHGENEFEVGKQLETIIRLFGGEAFAHTIVSYEPIWAIGTGLAASAEQAVAMHQFIRDTVAAADKAAADSLKILYGGSVNPQNAVQLLNQKEIDGALVGRCSLDVGQFIKICEAVPVK